MSRIQYGSIETFCPKDIFFSVCIETFSDRKMCINFDQNIQINLATIVKNLYKFWAQNVWIPQEAKCFNTPILYTSDAHFYNSSIKIGPISFFSSSDTQKFYHLLGCRTIGINSSLIFFFKFFAFFKFNLPDQEIGLD